nr:phosphatase PAP2 family protein [uncultured Rhodopila sp.]
MSASFEGNEGNEGNAANAGGGGNATSASGGWFFADRVDLPFVTLQDTGPNVPGPVTLGQLTIIPDIARFPARNWSAEWFSWLALIEFAASNWQTIDPVAVVAWWPNWVPAAPKSPAPLIDWATLNPAVVTNEIAGLVTAAANERADALSEILSQSSEFISYFLNLLTATPGAYPQTTKLLTVASQIGAFVAMYFKGLYKRPRPSQLCPALLPPIQVPGHASFPSGHSTQAHLMALCLGDVFNGLPQFPQVADDLWSLADRLARNREIAGLHYASDSDAGRAVATATLPQIHQSVPIFLNGTSLGAQSLTGTTLYQHAVTLAQAEWQAGDGP